MFKIKDSIIQMKKILAGRWRGGSVVTSTAVGSEDCVQLSAPTC